MEQVNLSYFNEETQFPLIVSAHTSIGDPIVWAQQHIDDIRRKFDSHPAILFRNFDIKTPQVFEKFVSTIMSELYGSYGDLPKKEGGEKIYKSTPYPSDMKILFHNESSHMSTWPQKQFFYCEQPSTIGGATPIVDCRALYQALPKELAQVFEDKGLRYVRTFNEGLDVSWQDFFKTVSVDEVKAQCLADGTQLNVFDDGTLQTVRETSAVINHKDTGVKSFFNQIQLHHPYWLEPSVREMLVSMFGEERLTRNVYFGDGSPIPDAFLSIIDRAYQEHAVRFQWQKGDVLMLDNTLVAHGRDEFEGERKIVVAMGDMSMQKQALCESA